ncbi:PALP-domain-containing protein [Nadsonia fulvescens var. elongata DSM 6958]|uniref:cysteine synthase n=1 Tax=Nadsonia fulvescens var. elongata DSM 6958 TaxID=857566 RepID=A0A1E3PL92_9ASCO|nr:PALP-domain-containing protein [Nadsonia fulvescens var. elongata DSM 6958]
MTIDRRDFAQIAQIVLASAALGATLAPYVAKFFKSGPHVSSKETTTLEFVPPITVGAEGLIGHTPMIKIKSLSKLTGCEIYAKMEMLNPGGSAKDRVALAIIQQAEAEGFLTPHKPEKDVIFEGTSGSTGISIAMLARAMGYDAHICLPDDTSLEKITMLESLGAIVEKVRPASIVDKNQYVNRARYQAERLTNDESTTRRGIFADQFENEANWNAHFKHTGPEIYAQTKGDMDIFVTGAGTGGTISGVSQYLKSQNPHIHTVLADPPGSGFYNKVKHGVMFDSVEREGTRRRHQVDTIIEGIGLNRITKNFKSGELYIDDAIRVEDNESLKMARWLVENDGLFIGSSSAVNCVAAIKLAKQNGPGIKIVTILCDSGVRHLSKFWKEAESFNQVTAEDIMNI